MLGVEKNGKVCPALLRKLSRTTISGIKTLIDTRGAYSDPLVCFQGSKKTRGATRREIDVGRLRTVIFNSCDSERRGGKKPRGKLLDSASEAGCAKEAGSGRREGIGDSHIINLIYRTPNWGENQEKSMIT